MLKPSGLLIKKKRCKNIVMIKRTEKTEIQDSSYKKPYHWTLKRIEGYRYNKLTELLAETIKDNISSRGKLRIIDFGCGDGKGTYLLWAMLKKAGLMPIIVGCDVSEKAIKWARLQLDGVNGDSLLIIEGGIDEALGKVEKDDKSPLILIMREVMEHLTEEEAASVLNTTSRLNKNNNWLLVTVPSTNSPVEEKHFRHYSLEHLNTTLLENEFKPIHSFGFGFRPRKLFKLLFFTKKVLNRLPLFWRLMIPFWQVVQPKYAVTLISLCKANNPENS